MKKIAVILIALINIAVFYFGVYRIEYDIKMPGGLNEVVDKVTIDVEYPQEGSFNTVFVYVLDRPTKIMTFIAEPLIGVDVRELSPAYQGLTGEEISIRGEVLYDTGLNYSLIRAYESAEADIDYFLEAVIITYYNPEYNDVEIGLEITGLDGNEITTYNQFIEDIRELESVTLNTTKGDYEITRTNGYFGLNITPKYTIYNVSPSYELSKSNVSGNSGGLLQSLSIFNRLTEFDYTYGLKIAGTGSISVDGYVGPIGGVEQKVIAASNAKADVFFVPSANYEDAMIAKEERGLDLNIVRVETFTEAVEYLKGMGE